MVSPRPRVAIDVSRLPTTVIGAKDSTWWGTVAFMVIEGMTLAVCTVCYLYLRQNFAEWPPRPATLPDLVAPTVSVVLLLAILVPMTWADRAARRLDGGGVRVALAVAVLMTAAAVVVRWWELQALNVRWDTNAYGSAAWATLGFHSALLAVDLLETAALAAIFFVGPVEDKHFTDVTDAALYQWFLSLVYVPLYVLLFLSPRWP